VKRRLLLAAALALLALAGLGPAGAGATTCQYQGLTKIVCINDYSNSTVPVEVPAGVLGAFVSVRGGHGGDGAHTGRGGLGATVDGTLTISPQEVLRVNVAASGFGPNAQWGFSSGGEGGLALSPIEIAFNGGDGGGASAITQVNGSNELPLVVAGGGGGGGGGGDPFSTSVGGPGGDGVGGDGPGSSRGGDGGNPPQQAFPFRELGGIGGAGGSHGEGGGNTEPPQDGGGAGGGGGGGYSGPGAGAGGGGAPHFYAQAESHRPDYFGAGGGGGGDSYADPSLYGASFRPAAANCPIGGGLDKDGQPAAACEGEVTITWLTDSTKIAPFAGGGEAVQVEERFAAPLQVVVTNADGPVAGFPVSFSLPATGPSASFVGAGGATSVSAETDKLGVATSPQLVSNGEVGGWSAGATIGGLPPVSFAMQNEPLPTATQLHLPSSVVAGVDTQFVAQVAAGRSGVGTPAGGISYFVDGNRLCAGGATGCEPTPLDVAGAASSPSIALAAGSHQVEAIFVPAPGGFGTSHASLPVQVSLGTSLVSVSTAPNPSEAGETVSLEATVAAVAPSSAEPQGTVRFSVDGEPQAGQLPLTAGKASLELPLDEGVHEISATYSGDALLAGRSGAATQAVGPDATAIVLSSSQRPAPFGASPTFVARLSAHDAPPIGAVSFKADGAPLCEGVATAPLDAESSSASCTPPALSLPPGTNHIEATFTPTGSFQPAATTITQEVTPATTGTFVTSQPSPLIYGAPYRLDAEVEALAPGLGEPEGSVRFLLDGAPLEAPVSLNDDGSAGLAPGGNPPAAGAHPLTAAYSGDPFFAAGQGNGFLVVDPEQTLTTLTSSGSPAAAGAAVSATAAVEPVGEGAATATGAIRFLLDGDQVGAPVPLQGGTATSPPLTGLASGEHDLQAVFSDPAGNFEGSRAAVRQQVLPPIPVTPPPVVPTRCSSRLQLTEAVQVGAASVRLSGLAPLANAGSRVQLSGGNRHLGSAPVRSDGTFSTRVANDADPAPTGRTVYKAKLGGKQSQGVRLARALASLGRGVGGPDAVRVHLHLDGKPEQRLELSRQTGCGKGWSKIRKLRSDRAGDIALRLSRPASGKGPAIYRLRVTGTKGHVSLPIVVRERVAG
jgi:hypothetical protein